MGEDKFTLGKTVAQTVATAGQVRSDVRENADRRGTSNEFLGTRSMPGDVPQPGQKPGEQPHLAAGAAPATVQKRMPLQTGTPAPRIEGGPTPPPSAPDSRTGDPAAQAQHAQNLDATKLAAKDLDLLLQGGKAAQQAAKLAADPAVKTPMTPQAALRGALIASLNPNDKSLPQSKLLTTPAAPSRTSQEPATREAVAAKVKAEAGGTPSGDAGEAVARAQLVAQKVPSPLLSEAGARREEDRGEIATDGPTAKALDNVVTGRGVTAIATAQEFTSGGYGGFGDPNGESAGLDGKMGAVAFPCVYGEHDHVETQFLCDSIALSGIAGGGEPIEKRIRHSIGDRIANNRETPLSQRILGDKASLDQAALGTRVSPYGPGTFA